MGMLDALLLAATAVGAIEQRQRLKIGLTNLQLVDSVLRILDQPSSLVHHVADRLGHDRRYALSARKLREELGWQPTIQFDDGLKTTLRWYVDHRGWWEGKLAGDR